MKQTLKTSDFGEITVLLYCGVEMLSHHFEGKRFFGVFDNEDNKSSMILLDFLNSKLQVEPLSFFSTQKNVKNLIAQENNRNQGF